MKTELSELEFSNVKAQVLKGKDLSRKGAIDELIVDLVSLLNSRTDFVTTSSCSGRIIVVSKECAQAVKKGCKWVFVSHEEAKGDDFINCLKSASGNLVVKFEPFILHALCRTTSAAKSLLTLALQSGYRNSGITLGKHGKITVAIRSTLNLEVPISYNGELLVSEQYLTFLMSVANEKMIANKSQISQLQSAMVKNFKQTEEGSDLKEQELTRVDLHVT